MAARGGWRSGTFGNRGLERQILRSQLCGQVGGSVEVEIMFPFGTGGGGARVTCLAYAASEEEQPD